MKIIVSIIVYWKMAELNHFILLCFSVIFFSNILLFEKFQQIAYSWKGTIEVSSSTCY